MKEDLAEQLLAEVMDWSSDELRENRAKIQHLARAKYNKYQQYSPGMQFIESLAMWLDQFEEQSEREIAFNFIFDRLIFISRAEMRHYVSLAYPEKIRPVLIDQVADSKNWPPLSVSKIENSDEYKRKRRKTLFLGLSDGAHTAAFRRANSGRISHEQIVHDYQLSNEKATDVLEELERAMKDLEVKSPDDPEFSNLFLLDDFTASGKSYFRKEVDGYHGKIYRVLNNIIKGGELESVLDIENLSIFVLIYVATDYSFSRLKTDLKDWTESNDGFSIKPMVIQKIRESDEVSKQQDGDFYEVIEKYFDDRIIDEHYSKGKTDRPFLGFDECALPVILYHNTPNNSLPIIWYPESEKDADDYIRGLFPRVDRHMEGWR